MAIGVCRLAVHADLFADRWLSIAARQVSFHYPTTGLPGAALSRLLTDGLLARRGNRRSARRRALIAIAIAIAACALIALRTLGSAPAPTHGDGTLLVLESPTIAMPSRTQPEAGTPGDIESEGMPDVIPAYVEGELESGQSVAGAITARGVPSHQLQPVITAMSELFDFRRAQPGNLYEVELLDDGTVTRFQYQTAPDTIYEVRLQVDGTYEVGMAELLTEVRVEALSGQIVSSLYDAVSAAGEGTLLAQTIVDVFQWDIDFSSQSRPGDAFRMLYEEVYLEGEFLRYGEVLAIEYRGGLVQLTAYYFDDVEGMEGFYREDGSPLQRMFLAAPCRYRRISSLYDPDRVHPVLGRRMPHNGVDYAAPPGTPVWAVAEGEVSYVGNRGASGNLVRVEHANHYQTGYAHLQGFARGLDEGDHVRQGEVIGYVGSTGRSTGPHLHFGLKRNDRYIDPLGDHNAHGPRLEGRALRDFQRRIGQLSSELDEILIAEVEQLDASTILPDPDSEVLHEDYDEDF